MLRHASCDIANVLLAMLDAIEDIGREIKSPEARQELLSHAQLVQAESQAGALIEADRQRVSLRSETVAMKLNPAR